MANKTFIPNWYEDKKSKITNKKIKVYIKMLIILNIILLSLILNISNEIKNKEGAAYNNNIDVIETAPKDTIVIEKYRKISNFFEKNNLVYKNINITKDNLEIDIDVIKYEDFVQIIKCIEKQYSIKKLTPNIKKEGNFNFKVIL
jgi:hypothetical protein